MAEEMTLTVLFSDLVGSTQLSSQFDPEDWRDIVRAYQQVSVEVLQRLGGHIVQYQGDGLLVYFGYPTAHEDDAQRAVRAGLEILDATQDLNRWVIADHNVEAALRLGVHTGLVVAGEIGAGSRVEECSTGF